MLQLAILLREQNKAEEAAKILGDARQMLVSREPVLIERERLDWERAMEEAQVAVDKDGMNRARYSREHFRQAQAALKQLDSTDPMVGMLPPGVPFETRQVAIEAYARLLVYSDGVYEIERPDTTMWQHAELVDYLSPLAGEDDLTERLYGHVRQLHGTDTLADDFSILDVRL